MSFPEALIKKIRSPWGAENASKLKQLNFVDVVVTGKKIGSGPGGEVIEVCFNELKCAGKKPHTVIHPGKRSSDAQRTSVSGLVQECAM